MTLKSAARFAVIGMGLLTLIVAAGFIRDVVSFARSVLPAISLLVSAIRLVADLSLTLFLYTFYKSQ